MSPRTTRRRALVAVPAVAISAAIAAAVLIPMSANAAVDLPDKTVEELLEFVESSEVDALSGTIEQTSELGIPDLTALTGSMNGGMGADDAEAFGDAVDDKMAGDDEAGVRALNDGTGGGQPADLDDLIALATGTHTANVYLDGERARMQVLDRLAERNVYIDGEAAEAWFVDSETKTATRIAVPEGTDLDQLEAEAKAQAEDAAAEARTRYEAETGEVVPTPEAVLDEALARLDETTEVTVGTDTRVAGRDVYELLLTPRTDDTLVGDIRFAIDGENGAPLAASITARGADAAAFEVAFTEVSFSAPDASVFEFEPAEDIAVTEKIVEVPTAEQIAQWRAEAEAKTDELKAQGEETAVDATTPTVYGEGWAAVVELPNTSEAGANPFAGLGEAQLEMLDSVTQQVDGGRVLQTSLVTVLLTDDGRVLAGAVPAERLVEAAESGR